MENGGQTEAEAQTEESKMCQCGMLSKTRKVTTHWRAKEVRGERGSTTESEIALRDNCAGWVPQLTWRELHRSGRNDTLIRAERKKIRAARIDAVDTIPGSNELQWLDVTIRRPTALTNMERSARAVGHASTHGEREKTKKYGNKNEIGPDPVKLISIELGGRMGCQTVSVLQNVTTTWWRAQRGDGSQEDETRCRQDTDSG